MKGRTGRGLPFQRVYAAFFEERTFVDFAECCDGESGMHFAKGGAIRGIHGPFPLLIARAHYEPMEMAERRNVAQSAEFHQPGTGAAQEQGVLEAACGSPRVESAA